MLSGPLALLGVATGVDAVRAERASPPDDGPPASYLARVGPVMLRDVLGLVGLALLVLLVAQLWNRACDPLVGLAFFGLGPAISAVLGGLCGLWGATLVRRDARRRQLLAGCVPLLVSLAVALARLYADPVVFAHDPFWGSFAGPLYDEAVAITPRLLWFRAYNVALALAAALALELWTRPDGTLAAWTQPRRRPWSTLAMLLLLALGASLGLRAERYHFNATVESLSRELPGELRTEHFVIHYDPASPAARELDLVEAEHEFAWQRLAKRVGREPAVPVHSFVFPTPERKRELIGAGDTEVAPPWRGHLYLNDQPFPHRVLHHELAHAFSAPLGDPLLGLPARLGLGGLQLNLALVEGFAEALAPRPREGLDLHDQAAVLERLELRPSLSSLMGLSFWGKSSRHAYAAAGSFCLWLVETRGVGPLVALYGNGGDFSAAYGLSLAELESQWVELLRARPIRERDIEALRQRYAKRAIFERPCAHRVANLLVDAHRADQRGDHETSLAHHRSVCELEPQRAQHRVALGRALAQAGYFEEARATLEQVGMEPELTHTLASMVDETLGDLAVQRGELDRAAAHYQAALGRSVSESVARRLQIELLGTRDAQLAPLVLDYIAPFETNDASPRLATLRMYLATRIRELGPHAALGWYLVGRQLLVAREGQRAVEAFEHALAPAEGQAGLTTTELERGAREGLLVASVRARHYARAREVLVELLHDPEIGNGDRYTYELWAERIEFFETFRPATQARPSAGPP